MSSPIIGGINSKSSCHPKLDKQKKMDGWILKKKTNFKCQQLFSKNFGRVTITIVFHLSFNRFNRPYMISEACKFGTSFVIMHLILFSV